MQAKQLGRLCRWAVFQNLVEPAFKRIAFFDFWVNRLIGQAEKIGQPAQICSIPHKNIFRPIKIITGNGLIGGDYFFIKTQGIKQAE